MKKILSILICGYLFCMCTRSIEVEVIDINTNNISAKDLDSRFRLKEIIVLDTIKNSMLNTDKINNLIFIDNKIVVSEYATPQIKIFDRKSGKLINSIERAGRGPEEYSRSKRIVLQNGNEIVVETFGGKLNYYSLDGAFIRSTKGAIAKNSMWHYMLDGKDNFLLSKELVGLYMHKDMNAPYFSVTLVSNTGKIMKGSVERDKDSPKLAVKSILSPFYKNGNDIYLSPITQNTIFKYNQIDSTFKPLYKLTFNGQDIDRLLIDKYIANPINFLNETYRVYNSAITTSFVVLSITNSSLSSKHTLLINSRTGSSELYLRDSHLDFNKGRWVANSEGYLIQIISYNDFMDSNSIDESPLLRKIKEKSIFNENMNLTLCIYEEI